MKVEYLKSFSKDLDELRLKSVKNTLVRIIELMEGADVIQEIPNIKKLKGHRNAYRMRIGDYRLGFFYDPPKITMARLLHRKDIYKLFP